MNKMKIERLAKVLAPIMTGKPVNITIGGTKAFATGDSINIPAGDFNDPDYVKMAHGYIDHELGHNAFTDFTVRTLAKKESALLNRMHNALEDVRMERVQGKAWPGAKINLSVLATLCVDKGLFPPVSQMDTPTKQVLFFCLYWGRFHINNQFALGPLADESEAHLRSVLGDDLIDQVMVELRKLEDADSNQECFNIARAITKLLEDTQSDSDDEGDDEDDSDSKSDSDDEGDDEDDSDSTSDSDDEGDDEEGSDSTSDSDDEGDDEEGSDSASAKSFLKAALNSDESDDIEDIHDIIAKELEASAAIADEEGRLTDLSGFSQIMKSTTTPVKGVEVETAAAKAAGRRVYKTLRRALFDRSDNSKLLARTGRRVAKNRLASVVAGAQSVFERRNVVNEPTAAISFVVDGSYSMTYDGRMALTNNAVFALVSGLKQAGIATQVSYYGVLCTKGLLNGSHLYRAKSFKDKHIRAFNFGVGAGNSTPTSEAMSQEVVELVKRKEDKKILFVLTDGQADCSESVTAVREAALQAGIKVIPIGIKTSVVGGFDSNEFISVDDLSGLDCAIKHSIASNLLA